VFPSQVGFERNLYVSPAEGERNRYWLETRLFQQIDSKAAPVLVKLNAEVVPSLSVEEMSYWSIFVRSLHHRTPDRLKAFRASGQEEWISAMEAARAQYADLKGENDPPTFEEYRALHTQDQIDLMVLRVLPSVLFSERVGVFMNELYKKYFEIPVEVPDLLISDAPLVLTNGLATAGGHYALPLAPRRLLIAAHERATLERATHASIRELARNMNRLIVERAQYFVGATNRAQDRFIRNRFGAQVRAKA
jgi:hypothetical protein